MIIDALTHIHPDPHAYGPNANLSVEYLIENIENCPVDRAVVTAIHAENNYGTRTEFVAEACARYPQYLIGFASVHPLLDENPAALLERYVTDFGMRGVKLHPRHQGLGADDPAMIPVVEKAAELGVPVAICGSQWKRAPLRDQMPLNIDVLCKRVPEARIILCHGGGFHFMDAFVLAVANDNVYLETSIVLNYFHRTPFEDQYMFTLKQIGSHRIIFGSDHPETPAGDCYVRSRSILKHHGFTDAECAQIFGDNMQALIGLR